MCPPTSTVRSFATKASRIFQVAAVRQRYLHCLSTTCFWNKQRDIVWCFDCIFDLDVQIVRREFQQILIYSACVSRVPVKVECSKCRRSVTSSQSGVNCWSCSEAYTKYLDPLSLAELLDFITIRNYQELLKQLKPPYE